MHYTLLKYWVKLALRLFYFRHQVIGKENIPKTGGVIFAGNHQNAVMDAFNIICNCGREPYFATRSDLFKKEWIKKVLLSLKMYPVYRLHDGRENMKQNEKAFEFFSNKLNEGKSVGIFPEGAASYKYQLLPFKKGMARLALKSLEKNPDNPIYIIPSGLQYTRKHDYQADLLIQFGKAIRVNDYYELYQEKSAKAIRQLTLDIHLKLKELIVHIEDGNYEIENQNRIKIEFQTKGDLLAKFNAGKQIEFLNKIERNYWMSILKYWISYPILIIGFFLHYPFRKIFDYRTHQNIKDSQFFATSKYIHGMFFFPIYYLGLTILIWFLLGKYFLLLLLFIPIGGRWVYRSLKKVY